MYIFSKTTLSFYPLELKADYEAARTWPDDAVEISEEIYENFNRQPAAGNQRGTDENGYPAWVDIPLPDIRIARENKIGEINKWRNEKENASYILNINGNDWNYNKITQQRLEMAVDIARQNSLPEGFFWTNAHNQDVPLTAGQLLELNEAISKAMFTKGLQIHVRQRQMKKEVENFTEVEKVINYPVDWKTEESN